MFDFFFKYSSYVFDQGEFVLAASWPSFVAAAVLAVVAVPVLLRYSGVRAKSTRLDRAILTGLRIATFAVLLFCLLQPSLVVSTAVPQENFVGIVIDDSRSMRITDFGGEGAQPRSEFVQEVFGDPDSDLISALSER